MVATGASIFLVERTGRKPLLMVSSAGMSVSILSLGLYFYFDEHQEVVCDDFSTTTALPLGDTACVEEDGFSLDMIDSLGWLPLTSLIVYKFFFAIGYGPLPWAMNGEFFSLEAKSLTSSILTAFNWFCAFIVTKFEVNVEDAIGTSGAYFIYASVCFVATFFVLFIVPETKGRSPQDMKNLFDQEGEKQRVVVKA